MTDPGTDPRVVAALAALAEVTDPADVGPLVDVTEIEPGVVDLHFASAMPGYVDWRWTVSTAVVEGEGATVLELQLLPGEGSLLAPPWVPWTERLAEWRRTHPDEDVPDAVADDEDPDDEAPDDEDPDDEADTDEPDDDVDVDDDDDDDDDVDDDDDDDDDDVDPDEDPFEAAGVEVEDVVIDRPDADVDRPDADVDRPDEHEHEPFRPMRGGDRF